VAPLARLAIDIEAAPPRHGRGSGSMLGGFLGQAAIRREQYDISPKIQNIKITEIT
jgi:hypothetical protein